MYRNIESLCCYTKGSNSVAGSCYFKTKQTQKKRPDLCLSEAAAGGRGNWMKMVMRKKPQL